MKSKFLTSRFRSLLFKLKWCTYSSVSMILILLNWISIQSGHQAQSSCDTRCRKKKSSNKSGIIAIIIVKKSLECQILNYKLSKRPSNNSMIHFYKRFNLFQWLKKDSRESSVFQKAQCYWRFRNEFDGHE